MAAWHGNTCRIIVSSYIYGSRLCSQGGRPSIRYRPVSNIRRTQSQNLNVSRLGYQLSLRNILQPGVCREWRCTWSSADRRCSNFIWVIINLIAYLSVPDIRDLTVSKLFTKSDTIIICQNLGALDGFSLTRKHGRRDVVNNLAVLVCVMCNMPVEDRI